VSEPDKTLWELLWDYDPNGLVALDQQWRVQVVNPAFCRMFHVVAADVVGRPAADVLGDLSDFEAVERTGEPVHGRERSYPQLGLHVRQVIFPVHARGLVACINVDFSSDFRARAERNVLKQETIEKVHRVVDNQMKVVQEIASLLGETTAETKASLLKLIRAIEVEM
jgi:PAS domain-containing protein